MIALKILLVTGVLAEEIVRQYLKEANFDAEIVVLQVPVAAFLTPQKIVEGLREINVEKYDILLVPGLVRGDAKIITDALGIPAFKGPKYAADLPTVLELMSETKLSTTIPACELLSEKLRQKALEEIEKVELQKDKLLKNSGNFSIKNLAIGKDFPMRVMAEIVDAALMTNAEIQNIAKKFVAQGASIIDLGMIAGENRPSDAKRMVKAVKEVLDVPISIDTLNPEEIKSAVDAGADMVMSADEGNLETIAPFCKNVAVVVIPTNQSKGYFPQNIEERVKLLEDLTSKARSLGVNKILGDPILEPSNIFESFRACKIFTERNPHVPLFVGVSNVTELVDIDSVGVNGLLLRLCSEVGANFVLATEKSNKAKGTVREEVIASQMMFLAKKRNSVPKDLGLDLLILKDKRNHEEIYDQEIESKSKVVIESEKNLTGEIDKKGCFRIVLDRFDGFIAAIHYTSTDITDVDVIIKGKTAENVYSKIVELELISMIDHGAYLGNELAKAELALKLNKEYLQDSPLFKKTI